MDTAQIVLMDSDLNKLTCIFDLSEEFNHNLSRTFMSTIMLDMISIGNTFLFGWGLLTAVLFNASLWVPQLSHVMLPLYKHRETDQ